MKDSMKAGSRGGNHRDMVGTTRRGVDATVILFDFYKNVMHRNYIV